MVELLASRGADINATDNGGVKALSKALHFGREPWRQSDDGYFAEPRRQSRLACVEAGYSVDGGRAQGLQNGGRNLCSPKARISTRKTATENTALAAAIRAGNKAIAEWLLANKADPNIKDRDGKTPMFIAINSANKTIIELSPLPTAPISTPRPTTWKTPLLAAIDNGNLSMVELLLSKKANPNLCQPDGFFSATSRR